MPLQLKPNKNAGRACLLFFAVPWTGFSLFWIAGVIGSGAPWWAALFGVPFAAIGFAMLAAAFWPAIVGLKVAPPEISISQDPLRVGDRFTVTYGQAFRRPAEVHRVVLRLLFRESATYRQGTDTTTVTHDQTAEQLELPGRRYEAGESLAHAWPVQIPPGGMHSFEASRNKLEWLLIAEVDVAGWPDFQEEYVLRVVPERAE